MTRYLTLMEELTHGLRVDERAARNTGALTVCNNLVPLPTGLHGCREISNVFDIASDWPWPQVFRGKRKTLAATDTAIYEVDESDWSSSEYFVRDYADPDIQKTLAASTEPFHFVDLGLAWMLIRSDITVFQMRLQELFTDGEGPLGADYPVDYVLACDDVTLRTGASAGGRVMLGGFDKDDVFSKAQWGELINEYYAHFVTASTLQDLDQQFLLWSSIGKADFWGLFFPSLLIEGFVPAFTGGGLARPPLFELIKENQFGWMPLPVQGAVQVVKPLGKEFVVYTEDGVFLLSPVNDIEMPTFGRTKLSDIGVASRGAVGGTISEHVYIDKEGDLNILLPGQAPTRLRYREFLADYVSTPIRIMYNADDRQYHMCVGNTGERHYIFTQRGLVRNTSQRAVSACEYVDNDLIGVSDDSAIGVNISTFTTDWLDFGTQELKTLATVEVSADYNTETLMRVGVTAIYADGTTYSLSSVTPVENGVAYTPIAGLRFRIVVWFQHDTDVDPATKETFEDLHVHFIRVGYNITSKHSIQGAIDGPTSSR